jgi:hypothetical protein
MKGGVGDHPFTQRYTLCSAAMPYFLLPLFSVSDHVSLTGKGKGKNRPVLCQRHVLKTRQTTEVKAVQFQAWGGPEGSRNLR